MDLPTNKTKIVCTIGPASDSPETLDALLRAGMNIARLNFSHGDFPSHQQIIERLREASLRTGRRLAIMADLPGPKMRIGELRDEPVELAIGDRITLTTEQLIGDAGRVSVTLRDLPRAVRPGDKLFLNDGLISLKVQEVAGEDVHCEVRAGGELRSRKGLNLPGIDLGISAFTERDRECLAFALANGVDAVSQSFVSSAQDVLAVRQAAAEMGHAPFIIAKVERSGVLDDLEPILEAADGIMVARGDLGVEVPIERMTMVQKQLMRQANQHGKPVITATQMLESMTEHRRPTRAEATDVANAILDGTDAVMLSGESAMGRYPVEAVQMLAGIAEATEPHRPARSADDRVTDSEVVNLVDLVARNVKQTVVRIHPAAVVVPTRSGATARAVTRYRLPVWVTAFSPEETTCQTLQFSYGVHPVHVPKDLPDWNEFTEGWLNAQGVDSGLVVLTEGPSTDRPKDSHRIEIINLGDEG